MARCRCGTCHLCHLAATDPAYRELFASLDRGELAGDVGLRPCRHRGPNTGKQVPCVCNASILVDVYQCALFTACSVSTFLSLLRSCRVCHERTG